MKKRNYFLIGDNCRLSLASVEDLEESMWLTCINDPEYCFNFMNLGYSPISFQEESEYLELSKKKGDLIFGIFPIDSSEMIGTVSLKNVNFINKTADHSQMIFPHKQSFQIFYESNYLVFNHAFNELNLNRISGGSVEKKQVDLMCNFFGFQYEGYSPDVMYKNSKFHGKHFIGLLKNNFKEQGYGNT